MSYVGNSSDIEQEKNFGDFGRQLSASNLRAKNLSNTKLADILWSKRRDKSDESDSDSDGDQFLCKGAFLLTPWHEPSMDRAALACEKLNFKGCFSLTKTATGVLFKFSHPDDYLQVFKKSFYRITGARFYKKVAIPCRPQKTFSLYVFQIPEGLPEEDIRHALYKFKSIVEVSRLIIQYASKPQSEDPQAAGTTVGVRPGVARTAAQKATVTSRIRMQANYEDPDSTVPLKEGANYPPVRITLADYDEFNYLLKNGFNFYGATYFPTECSLQADNVAKVTTKKGRLGLGEFAVGNRVNELLPVFDADGFSQMPVPSHKVYTPSS